MALRSQIINLVQGDFGNAMTIALTDRRTRLPLDLTGVTTATMKFRAVGSATVLFTESLTIQAPPTAGLLTLSFTSPNLDNVAAGRYEGEITLANLTRNLTPYELIQFRVREDA
ncbi:MAG TPA: hypothetical protein PKV98_04600 [Burkholderiaceae bacterium]|nr:hypothetical protein [Burkholderiaceae bacterium]